MRLTHEISFTGSSGRLSAGRRSRSQPRSCCCSGCWSPAACTPPSPPRPRRPRRPTRTRWPRARALFLVGCASCHGKNAEGISTTRGGQYGPLAGRRRRRRGRLPGRHRPDADGPARHPGPAQAPRLQRRGDRGAGGVRRLARPRPGDPGGVRVRRLRGATNEDIVRGGEFFRTNCTACHNFAGAGGALPRGRFAPTLDGVSEKHIYEAMLTGPQQMPVFSDEVLTPEDKRQIIAYLKKNEETPDVRRLHARLARSGLRGPVRLAGRHRRPGRRRRLDRGQLHPLEEEEAATAMSDKRELTTGRDRARSPDPGLPAHQPRPTDVDEASRSAPSARSPRCSGSRPSSRCCSASPTSSSTIGDDPTCSSASAPPTSASASDPRPGPAVHRRRHDPVGPQADGRPRDRRVPAPGRLQSDEDREETLGVLHTAPRSPASPAAR